MLYMIFGGSGSGKSAYAEELSMKLCPGEKVYLATLTDIDGEMEDRIRSHRDMRAGKHFRTIERGRDLQLLNVEGEQLVLLECMTNLLANEMYDPGARRKEDAASYIMEGIRHLRGQAEHVIVIAQDAFSEVPMDPEMRRYVRESGRVNQMLAKEADVVIEVKFGLPLVLKGETVLAALQKENV